MEGHGWKKSIRFCTLGIDIMLHKSWCCALDAPGSVSLLGPCRPWTLNDDDVHYILAYGDQVYPTAIWRWCWTKCVLHHPGVCWIANPQGAGWNNERTTKSIPMPMLFLKRVGAMKSRHCVQPTTLSNLSNLIDRLLNNDSGLTGNQIIDSR